MDLSKCKKVTKRSIVYLKDLTLKDPNTDSPYMTYDLWDTLEDKIKYHCFTIIFKRMNFKEEIDLINKTVSFQLDILQKSIDSGSLDIDFPNWDKETIEVNIYILDEDMSFKGIDVGLRCTNKYLEKRFRSPIFN